jgi:indole-3-glycerol phosphate synthase/phosphoribosylanthranilate isomerase
MSILEEIVEKRRRRVAAAGREGGAPVPGSRRAPLVRFGADPFLICEIKRRSPSRGGISEALDAPERGRVYRGRGVRSISVLTEEEHFSGSLRDLMEVKEAVPDAAVLRKDFLLDREDVEVSFRAGADAVLLIASILTADRLTVMHRRALELGMQALVEVHTPEDIARVRPLRPGLVGINSRDLRTFTTDLLGPLRLAGKVDWPARLVFESGIRTGEDALVALASGFHGILVGETAVRDPSSIEEIIHAFRRPPADPARFFWRRLSERVRPGRPLVKICGITREEDARRAAALGADVLGFILAPSPRRADPALLERLSGLEALKAAVVVDRAGAGQASDLAARGLVDVVQLHGEEAPADCLAAAFPYYKAVRLREEADAVAAGAYRCPRVLVDAYSGESRGGTGRRIPAGCVDAARTARPLWLAGGLDAHTIRETVERFSPELVDASSRLESSPGVKDPAALAAFFKEIDRG